MLVKKMSTDIHTPWEIQKKTKRLQINWNNGRAHNWSTVTYLLKDITSSLSLERLSNDWGKSSSEFFCKSRYSRFSHNPSSKGSTDSALQLRFNSVMRLVSLFSLQHSDRMHLLQLTIINVKKSGMNLTRLPDVMIQWTWTSLQVQNQQV